MRWAVCEAELIQAIGRGRGVNRGPGNPLLIDILTNVVLPIAVDEITTWAAIQPSAEDVMRARGAVPGTYADTAACYPDLFSSAEAARQRGGRNPGILSIGIPYRRFTRVFSQALYRRHGNRGPAARLLYDPARIDPATWLAERLGDVTILSTGAPPIADLCVEPIEVDTEPEAALVPEHAAPNIPEPAPAIAGRPTRVSVIGGGKNEGMGRPSVYTAEMVDAICDRLVSGESLKAICRDDHMPSRRVVHEWVADDRNGFRDKYARARAIQADCMLDEILEIADDARSDWVMRDGRRVFDHKNVSQARLRIDARKWLMARLAPKKWGNRWLRLD